MHLLIPDCVAGVSDHLLLLDPVNSVEAQYRQLQQPCLLQPGSPLRLTVTVGHRFLVHASTNAALLRDGVCLFKIPTDCRAALRGARVEFRSCRRCSYVVVPRDRFHAGRPRRAAPTVRSYIFQPVARFSILAQVSRRPIVRLNTNFRRNRGRTQ
jgi:hypothetical protein